MSALYAGKIEPKNPKNLRKFFDYFQTHFAELVN